MVTLGTGRDDPRGWVRAACSVLDVIEQAGPRDKLPALAQIAAESSVSRPTAARACQEPGPGTTPPDDDAADEMRARIFERYAELRAEGQQLQAQLDTLDATTPRAADTTLLDELPLLGDILPGLPPRLKTELFDAFDLHIWWNKQGGQATLRAELTEATLQALPFLLDPTHDGYHDTPGPGPMRHLGNAPYGRHSATTCRTGLVPE
jgi:hypothetical protein